MQIKNRFSTRTIVVGIGFAFLGCAAVPLEPGAARVIVSKAPVHKDCKFLGAVIGQQGGRFSGPYTSNRNLAQGALNDIRNQAVALGANYVSLESETAGQTGNGSMYHGTGGYSSGQTDVTKTGNAYRCPPDAIGLE